MRRSVLCFSISVIEQDSVWYVFTGEEMVSVVLEV